ncbi:GIY-YIG nuclease family protein [Desulfovibrio sp. OttesenSCG-928-A18]|nr:GIY-YIG nuclease family protein [Desulfovibrio sp. OttesenSCG-928-A18]
MQKPDLSIFPLEPGVYLYKDATGRILYVGKARRLRNRIASYFREASSLSSKTRHMLQHAVSIDILRTSTEKEALLLEASLIKKHRPRYNIVLRDDKEYLLFRIRREHQYPRVELVRRNQARERKQRNSRGGPEGRDKDALFFGPFSSGLAARETWKLMHRYFPLRRCNDRAFANRTRPCLYYDMGLCLAPCVLPVAQEEYQALLARVILLLSGKSRELLHELRESMQRASVELRFEDAARYRDQLRAVERTVERQSVVLSHNRTLDLVGVAEIPEGLALGVLFVREGLLLDGSNFFWPALSVEDTPELITGFLAQFYLGRKGMGESIPPRIVVPWLPEGQGSEAELAGDERNLHDAGTPGAADEPDGREDRLQALEAALTEIRGKPVHVTKPRDQDEDKLVLMAAATAREAVRGSALSSMAELLARRLRSAKAVRRIEVVDISHTGGKQTRAGMVVFEDEQPVTRDFRTYKLDQDLAEAGADAGDDYAALSAWARRRARAGPPWPDLLLVDGGKGQLAAVRRAFAGAGVEAGGGDFMLASIAKARDEAGRADRRAGNVSDRIFLPDRSNPLPLASGSPELLFLQRLRDAAHDFVIGRHRRARAAATLSGELTRLPGVGPGLARTLFERFGSLAAMADAGEEALRTVPGIGKVRAKAIAERLAMLLEKGEGV